MDERKQLEQQMSNARELVKHRDMATKLLANREFSKLVMDEYCVKEAARLVGLAGDPRLNAEQRADANAMGIATGHFKRWLDVVIRMGDAAAKEIGECEEALADLDAEDLEEDETGGLTPENHNELEG